MRELIKLRTGGADDTLILEALKATAVYTPDLDMKAMSLQFDQAVVENAIKVRVMYAPAHNYLSRCTGLSTDEITTLQKQFETIDSVDAYIEDLLGEEAITTSPHEVVAKLARKLINEFTALDYKIPFKFMTVEENTRLSGPTTVSEKDLRDWYGAAFR